MNILFVHPVLSNQGGAQLSYYWLVKGLALRGHRMTYATLRDPRTIAPELSNLGISVVMMDESSEIPSILKLAEKADLIMTGNFPATLWVGLAKEKSSTFPPVICNATEPPRQLYEEELSPHFLGSRLDPKFYFPWSHRLRRKRNAQEVLLDQKTVRSLDKIFAISDYVGTLIHKVYQRSAVVIPLGVGDIAPEAPQFSEGPFTFLAPAGLEPIKNFETVIKAFSRLGNSSARLVLTGDGYWRKKAEKLAERFGIKKLIRFAGWVDRDQLKDFYCSCHAVIYVPLDEPFGLVACEAGLFGKPSIVTNHAGPAEIVQDGITGIQVDPFNESLISKQMNCLLHDRDLSYRLGSAAQKRIQSSFNYDTYLDKFESLLPARG